MMGQEFLSFLLPDADIAQLLFFSLMAALVFITIILLYVQAKPETWENHWKNKVVLSEDGLDQELSSVQETSDAVASLSEKLADFMPGIVLVIGLLGTFLGIGIALNKASDILINSNTVGMDAAMTNLMSVMDGLGTKFKTSTWGIIAFLILKFWSMSFAYDDKRLRWCAEKIKGMSNRARQQQQHKQDQLQNSFLNVLVSIKDSMSKEANGTRLMMKNIYVDLNTRMDSREKKLCDTIQSSLLHVKEAYQNDAELMRNAVEDFSKNTKAMMTIVVNQGDLALKGFANLETGVTNISQGLSELNTIMMDQGNHALKNFANLETGITNLGQGLSVLSVTMSENNAQMIDQGNHQVDELNQTRVSMQKFIELNSDNLMMIKNSAELMSQSAKGMGGSANNLQDAIIEFRKNIADVLGGIKTDLGATIDMMGESFGENMDEISKNMALATDGISSALTSLSDSVNTTMNDVKSSIDHSIKAQKNAQHEFITTSETLNVNVEAMTGLVEDLREKILSGLKAISSSNREVISLNKRYEDSSVQNERTAVAIEEMVSQLSAIEQHNELLQSIDKVHASLSQMANNINSSNDRLVDKLGLVLSTEDMNKYIDVFIAELKEVKQSTIALNNSLAYSTDNENTSKALGDVLLKLNDTLSTLELIN